MRNILERAAAADLNGYSSAEEALAYKFSESDEKILRIWKRIKKRTPGAGGITASLKRQKETDAVFACMESMVQNMGTITKAITRDTNNEIETGVRREVVLAMKPTTDSINEIKKMLSSLVNHAYSKN